LLFFIATAKKEEANFYSFANFFNENSAHARVKMISDTVTRGSIAYNNYKNVVSAPAEKTFESIVSVASSTLRNFILRKTLAQVISKSSFDLRSIGESKTAIYIIVPDEKTTLHFYASMLIKQVYVALIGNAQTHQNRQLPIRVNFVLDEFSNIPKIKDMSSMISAARSRNIRFFLMVQSMHQLIHKYKKNEAQTIKGNCDNLVFLTTREFELLKEISNLCGVTFPTSKSAEMPLITTSDLQRLNKESGEALILQGRNCPLMTKLPDIDDYSFKSYPTIKPEVKQLPEISLYDVDEVLLAIAKGEIPIPFSKDVTGTDKFITPPPPPPTENPDIFEKFDFDPEDPWAGVEE
jgi:type IV secretion system protein VirD4